MTHQVVHQPLWLTVLMARGLLSCRCNWFHSLHFLFYFFWIQCLFPDAINCRLFSCGTNKEGESFLVEWNESDGAVKRYYLGIGKHSTGIVQFDTTKNRFLAAGDEFTVKFWDMDNVNLLTTTNADGGLPVNITIASYNFPIYIVKTYC